MGTSSNHAHRILCSIVKRRLLKKVWYTKIILHLTSFGADYTSGAGPVWDCTTRIQLARLAGNPVKRWVMLGSKSARQSEPTRLI